MELSNLTRNGITITRGCGTHGILVEFNWNINSSLTPDLVKNKEGEYKKPRVSGIMYLTADDVLLLLSLFKELYDDKARERVDAF